MSISQTVQVAISLILFFPNFVYGKCGFSCLTTIELTCHSAYHSGRKLNLEFLQLFTFMSTFPTLKELTK